MEVTAQRLVHMIAVAIAIGMLAQVLAQKARLPSIVLLLGLGILVGPDGIGWIDTRAFGRGLEAIVTIAVALILFEGGLQLHYVDLAAVGRTVRNLVTIGAAITVMGATVGAHFVAGFPWRLALLFGAIVSVTGPTVINPLLDRVRVQRRLDTVLRGEGIVIDPIGAIFAVVVLEIMLTSDSSVWTGLQAFALRMGLGAAIGLAGGWILGRILRMRRLLEPEIENLVVLAWVLALFAISELLAGESGLAAVVIAGMTVRRESIPRQHQLRRFKGELSVLFISLLFILLSAHLRLSTIAAVGWRGVAVVLLLMWVIRPLNVLASTARTDLTWRERLFVMWICPRGVVAISISSFIAILLAGGSPAVTRARLSAQAGEALVALVFLTIAITVVVQGITAAPVARLLGVAAKSSRHVVVVGANALGRTFASLLWEHGLEPLLVDANPINVAHAQRQGMPGVVGNALERDVLDEARLGDAGAMVGLTANQEVNFLVCQIAAGEYHVPDVHPVLIDREKGPRDRLVESIGGEPGFAEQADVAQWNLDLDRGDAALRTAEVGEPGRRTIQDLDLGPDILPLVLLRGDEARICHVGLRCSTGDRIVALVRDGAEERFTERVSGALIMSEAPA
ncbi:MAG TPA: cation:proton antiporter [Gemmatimonadota bacterium]|nr:cation:proton antiporter [Gemmatimonadota bacterium]